MSAARCFAEARFQLCADLSCLLLYLFVLGHDDVEAARGSEDVEHGNKFLVVIEPFSHRDNNEVIRSAGGPLSGWIEPAQRLDHVANEFQSDGFRSGCRKYVDNAAPNGERPVLLDGILRSKARVGK